MSEQITRQYNTPDYQGKRPLDFTPFAEALEAFTPERCARLDTLLHGATIPMIQRCYADGTLTVHELLTYYLDRIQRYAYLNAVIELNPDVLHTEPAQGPLYGIPVLLKDNIATGDRMHTTAGAKALENAHADRDAFIVARLRAAGALIIGKANLSEWANYMTSKSANGFSVLGGQTRSPYGRFDVSGSSSGSAAAVAANLVTVSIGTETSGSLISPASQNAVVTLKPSLGLISRDRIIPITDAQDTAGPMTRSVTDLALLLNTLAGIDEADTQTAAAVSLSEVDFTDYLDVDGLQGLRLGLRQYDEELRPGDAAITQSIVATLEAAGARVFPVTLPSQPVDYLPVLDYGMRVGVDAYLQATGAPFRTLADIIDFNAADLPNRAPFGQDLLEKVRDTPLTAAEYAELVAGNRATTGYLIRGALADQRLDALVSLGNYATALYAPAGFPALTVPAGQRDTGEPVGVTFFGDYLDDARLVRVAYAFEQAAQARRDPALADA